MILHDICHQEISKKKHVLATIYINTVFWGFKFYNFYYFFEKHLGGSGQPCKQDAREAMRVVFSVLTKRICMHKTNFLRK